MRISLRILLSQASDMTTSRAVRTIYHVDDDPDFLDEVRIALSPLYAVRSFHDPRRLRRAIRSEIPDLLILDLEMPGLSGHELLARVRNSALTQDTPVLFLTGRTDRAEKLKALAGGLDDYICKPPDLEELSARMENLLRRRPGQNTLVFGRLQMQRYAEACAAGLEIVVKNVLLRAAGLICAGRSAGFVQSASDCVEFRGTEPDRGRAGRIVERFNRLLERKGNILALRQGYLEEIPPPALVLGWVQSQA